MVLEPNKCIAIYFDEKWKYFHEMCDQNNVKEKNEFTVEERILMWGKALAENDLSVYNLNIQINSQVVMKLKQ
ncbi:hypothetical protein CN908_23295 [Bacillus thuringiensis]|nr:hypothetical protein CN908_23295 [Bacillus thuringiensis]